MDKVFIGVPSSSINFFLLAIANQTRELKLGIQHLPFLDHPHLLNKQRISQQTPVRLSPHRPLVVAPAATLPLLQRAHGPKPLWRAVRIKDFIAVVRSNYVFAYIIYWVLTWIIGINLSVLFLFDQLQIIYAYGCLAGTTEPWQLSWMP